MPVRSPFMLAALLAAVIAIAGDSASAARVAAGGGARSSWQAHPSSRGRRFAHARRAGERPMPVLWVRHGTLHWTATAASHRYVESRTSGAKTTYFVVARTADTPPALPGATVTYRVRPRWQPHGWSNAVKVSYPHDRRVREGEETAREREQREAREKAEREQREREVKEREAKERAERERREGEGTPGGAVALSAPPGIPAPSGGWHVAYADAFGAPLGSGPGRDNTIQPSENGRGCCNNSNEVAVEQTGQTKVGPEGLELVCSYVPGGVTVAGVTSDYTCGGATTDASFEYTYGGSETIVAECYCRWPVDSGGADPGFWSYTGAEEIDYFEGWGWNSPSWAGAEAGVPVVTTPYRAHEIYPLVLGLGFDPSLAFHRYATEITPNGSAFLVREYIDGVFRWSFEAPVAKSQDGLILTSGLRVNGQSDDFVVRSIELYQDGAHAGQGIHGGGIAPGTTLK